MIKGSTTAELILSDKIQMITPEFIFSEIKTHTREIINKTHRGFTEFEKFALILEERIEVIPSSEIESFLKTAAELLPDNLKDVQYLATALRYKCEIWSNDAGLKQQIKVKIFTTSELIRECGF